MRRLCQAGRAVTVTLTGGPGGRPTGWSIARVGAPDTAAIVQWTYVGAGVTNRTWTVTAPSAAGIYEFRLYLNNGYTRAATSAPITVTAGMPPTLARQRHNRRGRQSSHGDAVERSWRWHGLDRAGARLAHRTRSYLQWTYVGAGVDDAYVDDADAGRRRQLRVPSVS